MFSGRIPPKRLKFHAHAGDAWFNSSPHSSLKQVVSCF